MNNILQYQSSMSIVRLMLSKQLITPKEYVNIDAIIANKYGISLSSIYRHNPLLYPQMDGNMLPRKGGDEICKT